MDHKYTSLLGKGAFTNPVVDVPHIVIINVLKRKCTFDPSSLTLNLIFICLDLALSALTATYKLGFKYFVGHEASATVFPYLLL